MMRKVFLIGIKDLKIIFRDRAALVFMLLAPFLLTIGMGFVTGRFSGGSTGITDIPVVIVNQDQRELGDALVELLYSADLADLMDPGAADDPAAARQLIDSNGAAAAIVIPEGFTQSIMPADRSLLFSQGSQGEAVPIEVYTNPSSPVSAGIVKAIVDEFISRVEEVRLCTLTSLLQLQAGGVNPQDPGVDLDSLLQSAELSQPASLTLKTNAEGPEAVDFDLLAYFAPGMALMFLMYTVSYGGRSILTERARGTLPRLMVSPAKTAQILAGKVVGIFFTGMAQIGILILASAVFFQVKWGDPLGIMVLILAAVFGAAGWGMLITAIARTPAQVGSIGSAMMLIFGILGGSFINLEMMPPFLRTVSKITPNAWGLDGFTTLALGGTAVNLSEPITALLIMGGILFGVSVILFNRRGVMGQ